MQQHLIEISKINLEAIWSYLKTDERALGLPCTISRIKIAVNSIVAFSVI